jgi:hypothetical protein
VLKVPQAISLFKELIAYYGIAQLAEHAIANKFSSFQELKKSIPTKIQRSAWVNTGGQLMIVSDVAKLKHNIKTNKITSWAQVHNFYRQCGERYKTDKLIHAYTSLLEIENITSKQFTAQVFKSLLEKSAATKTWMGKEIYKSRAKDYTNPFRKMVYDTHQEMNAVMGPLEDNQFIQDQLAAVDTYKKMIKALVKKFT